MRPAGGPVKFCLTHSHGPALPRIVGRWRNLVAEPECRRDVDRDITTRKSGSRFMTGRADVVTFSWRNSRLRLQLRAEGLGDVQRPDHVAPADRGAVLAARHPIWR